MFLNSVPREVIGVVTTHRPCPCQPMAMPRLANGTPGSSHRRNVVSREAGKKSA
ncbi:MAG: hypothetical protein OXH76_07305 [Boseongicola sp.]|nr:hypothetical protein [Boseongicola sp.]